MWGDISVFVLLRSRWKCEGYGKHGVNAQSYLFVIFFFFVGYGRKIVGRFGNISISWSFDCLEKKIVLKFYFLIGCIAVLILDAFIKNTI